jgi:hypothetical protein
MATDDFEASVSSATAFSQVTGLVLAGQERLIRCAPGRIPATTAPLMVGRDSH